MHAIMCGYDLKRAQVFSNTTQLMLLQAPHSSEEKQHRMLWKPTFVCSKAIVKWNRRGVGGTVNKLNALSTRIENTFLKVYH